MSLSTLVGQLSRPADLLGSKLCSLIIRCNGDTTENRKSGVHMKIRQWASVLWGKDTSKEFIKGISLFLVGLCYGVTRSPMEDLLPKREFTYFQKDLGLTLTLSASFLLKLFLNCLVSDLRAFLHCLNAESTNKEALKLKNKKNHLWRKFTISKLRTFVSLISGDSKSIKNRHNFCDTLYLMYGDKFNWSEAFTWKDF